MSQAFARSSTMASSGVRENVHPNTKMELCGKILFFIIYSSANITDSLTALNPDNSYL